MRWTVFLRCETNTDTNTDVPLLSLERDSLPNFAQLGLIHREEKQIQWKLQRALLAQQTEHYFSCRRPCNNAARREPSKITAAAYCGQSMAQYNYGYHDSTVAHVNGLRRPTFGLARTIYQIGPRPSGLPCRPRSALACLIARRHSS